jgi:hypothetical protein
MDMGEMILPNGYIYEGKNAPEPAVVGTKGIDAPQPSDNLPVPPEGSARNTVLGEERERK